MVKAVSQNQNLCSLEPQYLTIRRAIKF